MLMTSSFMDTVENIPFLFLPLGQEFDQYLETFHGPFLSHGAGRLIPDQATILIDMSLQVLISGLGPLMNNKRFSESSLFSPTMHKIFPLLLLPVPRITLIQLLITYRTIHMINCFKSLHHCYICWRPGYTLCVLHTTVT